MEPIAKISETIPVIIMLLTIIKTKIIMELFSDPLIIKIMAMIRKMQVEEPKQVMIITEEIKKVQRNQEGQEQLKMDALFVVRKGMLKLVIVHEIQLGTDLDNEIENDE